METCSGISLMFLLGEISKQFSNCSTIYLFFFFRDVGQYRIYNDIMA